jgi:hypothetical protein
MICLLCHVFRHYTLVLKLTSNISDHNDLFLFFPFSFPFSSRHKQACYVCLGCSLPESKCQWFPLAGGESGQLNLLDYQSLSGCIVHRPETFLWAFHRLLSCGLSLFTSFYSHRWLTEESINNKLKHVVNCLMVSLACPLSVPVWRLLQLSADWLIAHHSSVHSRYPWDMGCQTHQAVYLLA